jgi:transposase
VIDYQIFCQIRQAYDQDHLSIAQIAQLLQLHRQTVSAWVGRARYEQRQKGAAAPRGSKLDAHRATVVRWLQTHPYSARQIYQRLRDQGYTGGYTIVKVLVRRVRPRRSPAFLTLQFAPGECAQIDWGSWGSIRVGNTRRRLSFFVLVLCHSRLLYVQFTLGQSQEQFLACHEQAFAYLGGCPSAVIVDNCKTAILSHRLGGPPIFNPRYLDYANHCGFTVKPCGPRKPHEKGRVENGVGYCKKNFLNGLELEEFAPVNPAARIWMETIANVRIHRETGRAPAELFAAERPLLRPLPANPYDTAVVRTVRVTNRCRINLDANRYSVPPRYASGLLTLKLYSDRLRLFDSDVLVAEHVRSYERQQDIRNPEHEKELLDERHQVRRQRWLLRFLSLSARAPAYHEQLVERRLNAGQHVQKIVALSEIYGAEAAGRAVDDADELGAYGAEYIANLLEQRQRRLPEAGALHLTRASDLLDLEIPPPDLSLYDQPPSQP